MYHLLHFRIHRHHFGVEIWMVSHQNVRVPCRCDKNGVHAAADRRQENLAHLKSDEEGKRQDDSSITATLIVSRACKLEIEKGKQSAKIANESRAHREHRTNEAIVHKCIDTSILHHPIDSVSRESRVYIPNHVPSEHFSKARMTYVHVSLAAGI